MPISRLERTIRGLQVLLARAHSAPLLEVDADCIRICPRGDSRTFVLLSWVGFLSLPAWYFVYISRHGIDSWLAPAIFLLLYLIFLRDLLLLTDAQQNVTIDLRKKIFCFEHIHFIHPQSPQQYSIDFAAVDQVTYERVQITWRISMHRITFRDAAGEKLAQLDLRPDLYPPWLIRKLRLLFIVACRSQQPATDMHTRIYAN
ncbi:hypothetical protein [Chitinophaga sp. Cy-1792]|uniref:hypothetical protein n=1 Tax=Chitinophaga sp. Cy-1792 TaxID=2608339 RepID=UPI0014206409|nr:hypothetical protein [Chitinophaga sp. Cy-1792]NIG54939.1 hypothetical protein [Chitinophaga sp. Cy-1792]